MNWNETKYLKKFGNRTLGSRSEQSLLFRRQERNQLLRGREMSLEQRLVQLDNGCSTRERILTATSSECTLSAGWSPTEGRRALHCLCLWLTPVGRLLSLFASVSLRQLRERAWTNSKAPFCKYLSLLTKPWDLALQKGVHVLRGQLSLSIFEQYSITIKHQILYSNQTSNSASLLPN